MPDSTVGVDIFHFAADLIKQAFDSGADPIELVRLGNRQKTTAFHVVLYLGAMLKAPPAESLRASVRILPTLKSLPKGIYRFLVVPFIRDYWRFTFDRNRFAFFMPRIINTEIEEALALEDQASVRPLLIAVARGLGFDLADPLLTQV